MWHSGCSVACCHLRNVWSCWGLALHLKRRRINCKGQIALSKPEKGQYCAMIHLCVFSVAPWHFYLPQKLQAALNLLSHKAQGSEQLSPHIELTQLLSCCGTKIHLLPILKNVLWEVPKNYMLEDAKRLLRHYQLQKKSQ